MSDTNAKPVGAHYWLTDSDGIVRITLEQWRDTELRRLILRAMEGADGRRREERP